jgi:hypothetical protein
MSAQLRIVLSSIFCATSVSCGDSSGPGQDGGADGTDSISATEGVDESAGDGDTDDASSGVSATTSVSATNTDGNDDDTDDGSTSTSTSSGVDSDGSDGSDGDETGAMGCEPGGDDAYDFSIIWIANSPEGTVSKIDTATMTELARYRTGPTGSSDPSRTTVNLRGDVAVANRSGSVVKIATRLEDCDDRDQSGTIETSQGPNDVLPWFEDECVLWFYDVPFVHNNHNGGPRAIAWDNGANPLDRCDPGPPRIWVGWRDQPSTDVVVHRIDADGVFDDQAVVTDWEGNWGHGTYGGATDALGNFWGLGTRGTLVRIDAVTFDVDRFDNPQDNVVYGIALDSEGNPWLAGWDGLIWKFDVATQTFEAKGASGAARLRGLAIDNDGMAWMAANNSCALVQYDTVNEVVVESNIALPGCQTPVGVSIDVDGFVWVVDQGSSRAYKVNPVTYDAPFLTGLVSPYTYSDMTGHGLSLVIVPQ